jgi:NAD(P)-dependent dehydrogenase (short-subunit alcohol dehydrogenase family)
MNLQLNSKRALVTGSTAGIGYAIAETLAREGTSVIVNGRTGKRVESALEKLTQAGCAELANGLDADLGTADGVRTAREQFPDLDILVNNLGIFEPKQFDDITDDDGFTSLKSTS